MDVLSTRCECPFVFCDLTNGGDFEAGRYWERMRFALMELLEHSDTCSDRRESVLGVIVFPLVCPIGCIASMIFHPLRLIVQ